MAREAWLKSEDPDKFASAAVKCEHPGGFCMEDGFCHREGQCFRTGRSAMTAACRSIERASEGEPPDVASEMRMAVSLLKRTWDTIDAAAEAG